MFLHVYNKVKLESTSIMSIEITNNVKVDEIKHKKEVSAGAGSTGNTPANVPVGDKAQIVALLEKLGITQEEYFQLSKDPEFLALKTDEEKIAYVTAKKQQLAAEKAAKPSASSAADGVNNQTSAENTANVQTPAANAEEVQSQPEFQQFNKKEFDKLDIKGKFQACMTEAAKNKYIYGGENPLTEEAWNNLSEEERNKLVSDYQTEFLKQKSEYKDLFKDETAADSALNTLMNKIQASNMSQVSLQDFNKMDIIQQQSLIYEYLQELVMEHQAEADSEAEDNLGLNKYDENFYKKNQELANAISLYVSKQTGEEVQMCPDQALKYIKENNVNMLEVKVEYLKSKENLEEDEEKQLKFLEKFMASDLYKAVKSNYDSKSMDVDALTKSSALEEDILASEYGEKFQNASADEKMIITFKYLQESSKNKEEYYAKLENYLKDVISRGDIAQAVGLYALATKDEGLQKHLAESQDEHTLLATALNINKLDAENTGVYAQNIEELEDKKLSRALGVSIRKNEQTTDAQKIAIAKVKVKDEAVQLANIDMQENAETAEAQIVIGKSIAQNCTQKVKVEATRRIGNLKKEAQLEVLNEQLNYDKSGEVKEAASESISTLHKDNQLKAMKMVKYSVQDMDEEFAKKIEMNLADQIEKCDKDNQLEMHKEVMSSRFSEVQEHAAANIKNYDPSVQSKAIDVVYESGNSKAVQKVIENLEKLPPDVQKNEVTRLIGEVTLNSAVSSGELEAHLMGGTLTVKELSQLSPSQRRDYYIKLFENASPAKKIEILMSIAEVSGMIHKRTIYTVIARFAAPLLKGMIDSGMGKSMLEAGLPVDAVNKILTIMKSSTNNEVIGQLDALKKDSGFAKYFDNDELKEAKGSNEVSAFMKNAFTPPIDSPTRKKLKENESTMYMNI